MTEEVKQPVSTDKAVATHKFNDVSIKEEKDEH